MNKLVSFAVVLICALLIVGCSNGKSDNNELQLDFDEGVRTFAK